METIVKKLENCEVEITATFDKDEWKQAQETALNKLASSVKLDGFRQGKAPKNLLKQRIGTASLLNEAVDVVLQDSFSKIFLENNVQPVAQPTANVTKMTEDELEVVFNAIVAPEINEVKYKDLEVEKEEVVVTDEDIDNRLKQYQDEFSLLEVKGEDEAVEDGDTAKIDFEGFKDGEAFAGGKGEDYDLVIGSGSFIPGFEDQVIGMKVNEEKDINVTFPEQYQSEELAGADAVFKVKVKEIRKKVLPEIDDDLALDVNIDGVETLEQLKENIKETLTNQKQAEADRNYNEKVYDVLVENNPMDVPQPMVEQEVQNMISNFNSQLAQQGINMDLYQQMTGQTLDDIKEEISGQAEKNVKVSLLLEAIVKAENITVSEDEINEELQDIATMYGMSLDDVKKQLAGNIYMLENDIANRKALDVIKENVAK